MEKIPTVCCVIIINKKEEILFIKRGRDPYKGQWALISGIGYAKQGLTIEEATEIEVFGDIKVRPFNIKKLFKINDKHQDIVVFEASVDEKKISPVAPYAEDYIWKSLNKIIELGDLAFDNQKVLQRYSELLVK
jgi:ADP-ribose pyrophosphatase YjhB (NUDIX family)